MKIRALYSRRMIFFIVLLGLFVADNLHSQDLNSAKQNFLNGLDIINNDPQGALDLFNVCIDICIELGEEGDETRIEAESRVPTCHYKIAYKMYKDNKIEEAIEAFKKTAEIAGKYQDNEIKEKAEKYIPKLYLTLGINKYKAKDFNGAISSFNDATTANPLYATAYYYKGLAYSKMKDDVQALALCEKAIEVGLQTNETKIVDKAEKKAHNILLVKGVDEKKKNNYLEAIKFLNKSLEFKTKSAEAYFQLAFSYNKISEWEDAIKSANKAIEFDNSDDEKKARIYYELGNAHKGAGNKESACDAFKKALYGAYTESAKYQIEVDLKCQ